MFFSSWGFNSNATEKQNKTRRSLALEHIGAQALELQQLVVVAAVAAVVAVVTEARRLP